jgi:F-type H+-transporting ATPase subunit delta
MSEVTHAQAISGYATALLSVARAEGDAEGIADELFRTAQAFGSSEELRATLSDSRVPNERKLAIVSDLLGSRASATTVSLVDMLVSTGRIKDFAAITAEMSEQAAAAEGEVVAEVRSAIDLDEATIDRLADRLAAATGKSVSVRVVVDPAVIGGIVARVGDTVFDGSVRSRLEELREAWG